MDAITIQYDGKSGTAYVKRMIGQLAIHYTPAARGFVPYGGFTGWTLSHVKSGRAIVVGHYYHSPSLADFEALANRLAAHDLDAYWEAGGTDLTTAETVRGICRQWVDELEARRAVKRVTTRQRFLAVSFPE